MSTETENEGARTASCFRRNRRTILAVIAVVVVLLLVLLGLGVARRRRNDENDSVSAQYDPNGSSPSSAPTNLRGTSPPADFYENNEDQMQSFLADPEFMDREFYMVNIVAYRDQAVYKDGRETNLTGFEANQIYASYVLPQLLEIGAGVVFQASVEWNMGEETPFTDVSIVRYPNTTAFRQMTTKPEFAEHLVHKEAGLGENFVLACEMVYDIPFIPPLENPPFPSNDTNLETAMININDYRDKALYQEGDADADNNRTGREAYDMYSSNAGPIVAAYGVRRIASMNVQAVVTGEVGFETLVINWFPSDENFHQVIANPERQSYSHHRYAGIEEKSKSFKVMPITLNEFMPSSEDIVEADCNICGDGNIVSNPSGMVDLPDNQSIECSQLESAATAGAIPSDQCEVISFLVYEPCGCIPN